MLMSAQFCDEKSFLLIPKLIENDKHRNALRFTYALTKTKYELKLYRIVCTVVSRSKNQNFVPDVSVIYEFPKKGINFFLVFLVSFLCIFDEMSSA